MTFLSDRAVDRLRRVATWPDMQGTRYTLCRELGRGGMGTVYLAHDATLDREVAVKVINATGGHAELESRMRTEARVLARLEHPGIVPIHDVGISADGRVFYVMKYVHGDTLERRLAQPADLNEMLRVFERICEPVAFAHARGYVHRDLKPQNIMVASFGEVLVLDWGVAKILGEPRRDGAGRSHPAVAPGRTDPGTVMGTAGFMPPEQALGDVERIDPRSDVYALGAILYTMLAGEPPPPDLATDLRARVDRMRVPKRLSAVCRTCLAPAPEARYAHAAEVADDISRFRAGHAVRAYPEGVLERAGRLIWKHRTPVLLVVAYLVMRVIVALAAG